MNKISSIILIVIACVVVLGGTYWYFGMHKPNLQEEATPTSVVTPAKVKSPAAKDSPAVATKAKTEPRHPKKTVATEQKESPSVAPVSEETIPDEIQKEAVAVEPSKKKPMPNPIAPSITKGGSFGLHSFGAKDEDVMAEKDLTTSVLSSEESPSPKMVSTPATKETAQPLEAVTEKPVVQKETPVTPEVKSEDVQMSEKPEAMQEELSEEVVLAVQAVPEPEQEAPASIAVPPPAVKILRSETAAIGEKTVEDKVGIEASLSVSFLDYNLPRNFTSIEKGFNVSLDVMSQKEQFGWGGTLEIGKNSNTDVVQISLLARTAWQLGKGVVTFPLSVSFGPALFIDQTAKTTEFGMKGRLGAGITYAISESFRMFYAIGVGATYNFSSPSFRFVLEPMRIGVGFSF